ncbi:hypothetical protein XaplCFBP3123_13120 [Xanthomonas arboricola pv. populi]|nr:hypothetical protein XaplCFBP3123_13120 [Xanthomonas arboricola pv. populi]
MRQRPWGNDASAYRTPCSPCPVRHTQCDTRMTDYAALKLTEMFVRVERLPQRGGSRALPIIWSRWRWLEICGICIPHLARLSHTSDVAITLHRPIHFDSLTRLSWQATPREAMSRPGALLRGGVGCV